MACGWMNSQVTNKNFGNVSDFPIGSQTEQDFPSAKRCQSVLTITVTSLRTAAKWLWLLNGFGSDTSRPADDYNPFTFYDESQEWRLRDGSQTLAPPTCFSVQHVLKTSPKVGTSDMLEVLLPLKTLPQSSIGACSLSTPNMAAALPRPPDSTTPWPLVYLCPGATSPQPCESVENSLRPNYMGQTSASFTAEQLSSFQPFSPSLSPVLFFLLSRFFPPRAPVTRPR